MCETTFSTLFFGLNPTTSETSLDGFSTMLVASPIPLPTVAATVPALPLVRPSQYESLLSFPNGLWNS
jgi:hypothetical protein